MLRFGSAKLVNCLRGLGDEGVNGKKANGEDLLVDWPSEESRETKFPTSTASSTQQQHRSEPDPDCVSCTMSIRSHERDVLLARLSQEHHLTYRTGPNNMAAQCKANPCA